MGMVRVVNENVHPFKQEFKEQMISLAAKGEGKNWIDMDRDDAVHFLGMYYPMKKDANDQPDPRFFKKLFIQEIPGAERTVAPETHTCQKCCHVASTKEDLDAHIEANHLEDLADADFKEKKKEEIAKRGRGRPPKAKESQNEGKDPSAA